MNYSITYTTDYRYDAEVTDQHNALRVRPLQSELQQVEGFDLSVDPGARLYEHTDYFGTSVIQFAIAAPHDHLSVRAESRVRIAAPDPPPDPGWEALEPEEYRELGAEYLDTPAPALDAERIGELEAAARAESPLATLRAVCELIPDRFAYRPGATYVGSTVDDLLSGGAGVCQDFAHLALNLLRGHGIASRYVSGYLFAPNGDDDSGASAEVNTHAWVESLLPATNGGAPVWVAADPTNRSLPETDHVKIGHGRAYSDVPPIRGVFHGGSSSEVSVNVKMVRLAETTARG